MPLFYITIIDKIHKYDNLSVKNYSKYMYIKMLYIWCNILPTLHGKSRATCIFVQPTINLALP